MKLRLRSVVRRTGSLIAQHLHGVGARRFVGWIESRKKREDQRDQHDRGDLERVSLGGQVRQEAYRRIPKILASDVLDRIDHVLPEVEEDRAKDGTKHDAQRTNRHS